MCVCVCVCVCVHLPNPSATDMMRYKVNLLCNLNLEHSFFYNSYLTKAKEPCLVNNLPEAAGILESFMPLVWFGLVWWFYGISTFVGYLMPNPFLCK